MLKANFHTHTTLCDGLSTAEEMAAYAMSYGFRQLGFSGHMDPDIHMDFAAYTAEIDRLKQRYAGQLDILTGVELDVLYDPECAPGAEYVIGSTHFLDVPSEVPLSVDNTEEMFAGLCAEYFGGDWYKLVKAYYELEASVFDVTHCDMVGHFDLVTRFNDSLRVIDETDRRYTDAALGCMEHLVRQGVPFEINCGAVNRGRKEELYPNRFLLKHLHEFGGEIFIGSDAHEAKLLSAGFDIAVSRAMEAGFTHVNILKHDGAGRVVTESLALDLLQG